MPVCAFAGPCGDNEELNEDEIKTCFIEPDYYPDYDVAPAPMPAPEKAPKTGDFSMLPQLARLPLPSAPWRLLPSAPSNPLAEKRAAPCDSFSLFLSKEVPMKKLLSLAAALALTAAVLSCSMVAVRASDHYGWQEGEPTPVGGFPATPTPVPVKTSFIEPNYYPDYDRITPPEEAETAPKTNAGSLLPQFALAAVAVGSIAIALKRTK